jgi:hypothetical protein
LHACRSTLEDPLLNLDEEQVEELEAGKEEVEELLEEEEE